ncbi:ead/Ea22-like family protein [Enterobacter roggenkampii]|nr:ead/Ea22-like family protein [Enterobacter roggenkampii]MCM6993639.1 ead/Ea22-like family protein [Enterobacter roggenkampii]
MSNIDKQARDKLKSAAAKAADNFDPNMFVETRDVLGLLDELEAKDSMIAAQQHEIRTLLNALEGRPCPKCNDTGMADSGGTQPWGEPISVPCDCAAPPSPVAVPAAMEMDDDFDSSFEHGKAVGWNAYRAAMLQGADGTLTNEGTIPVTQFKPVADLYGLTSPTGGETSFTFDAVEARDFIDGGWSCQEYVELERFQEAVSGNSPVIPDGWVVVPVEPTEEMNKAGWTAMNEHDAINPTYRAMLAAAPQQED